MGRSKSEPAIFTPFQYPSLAQPVGVPAPSPTEEVRRQVAKVRGWAHQLRAHEVSGLGAIAKAEGISVARVSQLLVLDRLTAIEIEDVLKRLKRVSVRAMIHATRTIQTQH